MWKRILGQFFGWLVQVARRSMGLIAAALCLAIALRRLEIFLRIDLPFTHGLLLYFFAFWLFAYWFLATTDPELR